MKSDMLRFVQKDFLISVLNEMHDIATYKHDEPNENHDYWM